MVQKIKKRYLVISLILAGILFYLFWGPLFPWNPIKIGYTTIDAGKATLYITDMTDSDSIVYRISELILEEETFHDLKYSEKLKIVILSKESNMQRYVPWLRGKGYSVSLGSLNLVYIGPTARKSPAGIERYLKHELSHLLIGQNTTFDNSLKIHEQGWLAEGTAEYFSGHSFYSKSEFMERCKNRGIHFSRLYEKNPLDMSFGELKLKYSYFRFFVEFLVEKYGLPKFQEYLKRYLINPQEYEDLFVEIYAADLNKLLDEFRLYMN